MPVSILTSQMVTNDVLYTI